MNLLARIAQQAQQSGRTYQFPDPYNPGQFLPYDEARQSLSKLGEIAGKIKPHQEITIGSERLSGGRVKELYASTLRAWQQQPAPINGVFTPIRKDIGYFTGNGGTIGYLINKDGVLVVDSQSMRAAPIWMISSRSGSSTPLVT